MPELTKQQFEEQMIPLRLELLDEQFKLLESRDFSVLILIGGSDFAGKARLAHRLFDWMDVHYLSTLAFGKPDKAAKQMPAFHRYWCGLPPRGEMSLVFGSWYNQPIRRYIGGKLSDSEFKKELQSIADFEKFLVSSRVQIIKFWLTLSKDELEHRQNHNQYIPRFKEWQHLESLPRAELEELSNRVLDETSTTISPWQILPSDDTLNRDIVAGRAVVDLLRNPRVSDDAAPVSIDIGKRETDKNPLSSIDFGKRIDADDYDLKLRQLQHRLHKLTQKKSFRKHSVLAVFEGSDAAGKGGAIRRVTNSLDPRQYEVHRIGAPSVIEASRPYLWRFWTKVPQPGQLCFLDRSYYGRVLVERVEGFAKPQDWQRAYDEIVDFEEQLREANVIVVKFWLQISLEEQLARFRKRESKPHKRYKLTPDDWRNREKWDAYQEAATDMIALTNSEKSSWHVIPAEQKRYARILVLSALVQQIEKAMASG